MRLSDISSLEQALFVFLRPTPTHPPIQNTQRGCHRARYFCIVLPDGPVIKFKMLLFFFDAVKNNGLSTSQVLLFIKVSRAYHSVPCV